MTEIYSGPYSKAYGEKKPKISPNDEYHRVPKKESTQKSAKPG
ncbi:MAG: hypothetical protein AAB414_05500 [Patescibacteria group bacterium]